MSSANTKAMLKQRQDFEELAKQIYTIIKDDGLKDHPELISVIMEMLALFHLTINELNAAFESLKDLKRQNEALRRRRG
jgi:hypothetical protein